jgi:type I restriction enzyme S subunit
MMKFPPSVPLAEILKPVSRPEPVDPEKTYRILGAHWYAEGLFVKDTLLGSQIRAEKVFRVEKGDFVYNRLFAWKGSFALATDANVGCYVSNEFPSFAINQDRADSRFLQRYFSRASAWEEALGLSTGGTPTSRNRLKEEKFLAMEIPLPPLPEQQRIVARIEELAAKIDEARGLRQKAAEEAEAFVTSFHAKLAGTRMKKLDDILRLDEDLAAVTPTGSYPQVGIKSFGAGLFAKSAVTGSDTTYKTFNRLYEGALILSQVKGWEGAVAICPATLAGWFVSPEYRTFRCVEDQARPGYLAPLVRTRWFWEKLGPATRGVGARRERTRPEQFMNIEIPIPTIENQAQGERVFTQVDALKKLQTETTAELDALLPSLLDKAFKGDL